MAQFCSDVYAQQEDTLDGMVDMMFTLAGASPENLTPGLNDMLRFLNETSKSSELSRHCVEVSEDFIALIKKVLFRL